MSLWLKRIAYVVGTLVVLVLVSVCTVYAMSEVRFRRTYSVASEAIMVADDSATLARGQHIATAVAGCAECHGEGLGGGVLIDAPPMGRLVALNLTTGEGGVGASLTPELIERAVRHGVGPDGRANARLNRHADVGSRGPDEGVRRLPRAHLRLPGLSRAGIVRR